MCGAAGIAWRSSRRSGRPSGCRRNSTSRGVLGVKVYYALIGHDPTTRDKHLEAGIFDFLPHHQLELLDRRGAWVTLHVPKADRLAHPANIAEIRQIRRQYPRIKLVIAHLGRSYTLPHAEQSLPQLAGDEGLYFDLSAVHNPEVLRFALQTLGSARLLYGSDNPIFYMRGRQQWQGASYVNRTNHPFAFNRERESPNRSGLYALPVRGLAGDQGCLHNGGGWPAPAWKRSSMAMRGG